MCEIITGYTKPTCRSVGGLRRLVIYNLINRATITLTENDDEVTALTLNSGKFGYTIELEQDLSSATENEVGSRETGTFFVEQALAVILNDNRKETRNFVNAMGKSTSLGVCGLDNQGVWRHYGVIGGLTLNEGTTGSGTAKGDRNGSELTLSGTETELAPEIAAALVEAILEPES